MAGRSPARFLAPLVLVGFVIALFVVVTSSDTDPEGARAPNQSSGTTPDASPTGTAEKPTGRRRYIVRAGDTPSSIAEKTGVPLEQIMLLNPDLDPQTLSPGQRIQLRE